MEGGGTEKREPGVDLPAAVALGPSAGAAAATEDCPPSPPIPPPVDLDLTMEAEVEGWPSLEDWDNYLTIEEEKLAQEKLQFEEQCEADWAKFEEYKAKIEDTKKQFELQLQEGWAKLEEDTALLAQQKRQLEKQLKEDRIKWDKVEAELRRKNEELDRLEHELHIREEALDKLAAMKKDQLPQHLPVQPEHNNKKEGQLQKRLLVHPEHNNNEDDDAWGLGPIVTVLAVVSGFALLFQTVALFPLEHIVVAFAALWALGSIVLSFRLSEIIRGQNTLSHHAAWLAFLSFTLLGLATMDARLCR